VPGKDRTVDAEAGSKCEDVIHPLLRRAVLNDHPRIAMTSKIERVDRKVIR
jgi:hypothetical protein